MSEVLKKFSQYSILNIYKFIQYFLPEGRIGKHVWFKVFSLEGKEIYVWAETEEDLCERFDRYLNLEIYL